MTEKLLLGVEVAGSTVTPDADAEDAGPAALALGLENGIEDGAAAAIEIAVGADLFAGERVLGADVFAAAALEDEAYMGALAAGLLEVEGGGAGADIRPVVLTGEGIHGVLAEITLAGGGADGVACDALEGGLVEVAWGMDEEKNGASVLANGLGLILCHRDVALDNLERLMGDGIPLLGAQGAEDGPMDVARNFDRGAADEFEERLAKVFHCRTGSNITRFPLPRTFFQNGDPNIQVDDCPHRGLGGLGGAGDPRDGRTDGDGEAGAPHDRDRSALE